MPNIYTLSVWSLNSSIKFDRKFYVELFTLNLQHIILKHKFHRSLMYSFISCKLKNAENSSLKKYYKPGVGIGPGPNFQCNFSNSKNEVLVFQIKKNVFGHFLISETQIFKIFYSETSKL